MQSIETFETSAGVILSDGEISALFRPDTFELFEIDTAHLPAMQVGRARRREDSDRTIRSAMAPLVAVAGRDGAHARINRLTLNISNACNLWCSYCYADHGHYHSARSFMPVEQAQQIVQRVLTWWRSFQTVHFFGGEPLMNLAAIDAVGQECERRVAAGQLPRMPRFVATTNGTMSSPPVLACLKRWDIHLTISWDGPKEIHDAQRPTLGEGSSYDRLMRSLDRFQANGIEYDFETTYTRRHMDAGMDVVGLLQFLHAKSGQRSFHLAPVSLPPDGDNGEGQRIFSKGGIDDSRDDLLPAGAVVKMFRDAARMTVANMFSGQGPMLAFAHDIAMQIFERRHGRKYCPAFFDQISIAADGTVFPCFMFIGDSSFEMGNILTDAFPNARSVGVLRRYFEEFGANPTGSGEWYAPLSGGCIASDYLTGNSMAFRAMEPMFVGIIEECLLGIVRHSADMSLAEGNAG